MDDPESNMVSSECYEPYEVTPQTNFRQNSDRHLSFFHVTFLHFLFTLKNFQNLLQNIS